MTTAPNPSYLIIEAGQPLDGEILTFDALMKKLPYADHDAEVVLYDASELQRDLATSLRIVTADVVSAWWDNHYGAAEAMDWIASGKPAPGLALRFYADECGSYENRVAA